MATNESGTPLQELWLVFYDEGISLRHYIYTKTKSQKFVVVEPSPSNILISHDDNLVVKLAGWCSWVVGGIKHHHRIDLAFLLDFGSAVDAFTHAHMYGDKGPTQAEETREYQPPEPEATRSKSYLLHVLTEFCIFQPPSLARYHEDYALVHDACNFGTFNTTIQSRDPLGLGLQDPYGLHLLWQLLQWDPAKRMSARDALAHAYFQGPYVCNETGRHFPTEADLALHQAFLETKRTMHRSFVQRHYDLPDTYFCPCRLLRLEGSWLHECGQANPASGYDLYVVLDGHMGLGAATYVRQHIGATFAAHFADIVIRNMESSQENALAQRHLLEDLAIRQTLADLHASFMAQAAEDDFSGTTCTLIVHFRTERRLVVANVGDSRAVLYTPPTQMDGQEPSSMHVDAMQLTQDHSPNDPDERRRIESSGGFVSYVGVWRVMGQLAVSRTLGDRHLSQYVSCDPSISHVNLPPTGFFVVASDGVWETMDNAAVGRFVSDRIVVDGDDLYAIAADVVIEAFVHGSSDNLFAMVVAFDDTS
ncbi:hypothetical protein DYB32_005691 [Aphanomyces invadans]|uniref:PPM-type phosphatase domain-containing protein n=1 Tax=Aphanomyces invadans TaxID=157072 RepID=A0A418ATV9_9STRA|nr:hypothetical protein DYB32_005691 [Aphanomyces invadans]